MKIYEYKDHDEYVAIQTDANKRKLKRNHSFVKKETMKLIKSIHPEAKTILCHGTRNGAEQLYFKEFYPDAEIIGTEISDTASQFPMTVQHDFHEEKEEWINYFDIVYSNSWDHSYDPDKSLLAWRNQMRRGFGRLYIDHAYNPMNNQSSAVDPLEIYHEEIEELIFKHGMRFHTTFGTRGGGGSGKPCRLYVMSYPK